tara:strand:+ start:255 stop:677 length:423 start_codon:yes stop_codon:yes gene_type:complete
MRFYLALFTYILSAILFSCSKSQTMPCSGENYIQSSFFNNSNGMKHQQRNIESIYPLEDWDQQYLDTKYSCKKILTQFFYCNICCNSEQNELIAYSGRTFEFNNSISATEFTSEIISLLGTMSIGSSENQIFNDSINNGH